MTSSGSDDRRLAALHAPRRNRYYAGKMLAVADLEKEQEYVRGADAQLARLVLGAGVVCGLDVTAGDAGGRPGIQVSPGLALDPWGRRIVVPRHVEVDLPAQAPLPASMVVRLRYEAHEADVAPSVRATTRSAQRPGPGSRATASRSARGPRRRPSAGAARRRSSSSARERLRGRSRCWRGQRVPLRRPTPA